MPKKEPIYGSSDTGIVPVVELVPGPASDSGIGPNSPGSAILEYAEISGRVLRFSSPPPEVLGFLQRVREVVEGGASAENVRALVFGPENPVLARHPTLPGAYPDASS